MIEARVVGLEAFGAGLNLRAAVLTSRMRTLLRSVGFRLATKVKANKLSGQVLKVRTGRLRRSITSRLVENGGTISVEVGTNVDYGLIHEFGGREGIDRAIRQAKMAFASQFTGPKDFAKRSFLRTTLYEERPDIEKEVNQTVAEVIRGA